MLETDIVQMINNYLTYKGVRFSNESRMGIGIPDVSLNIGANNRLTPINDYFMLSILEFIGKKQIVSFMELEDEFLLPSARVKQYVNALAKLCLVKIKNKSIQVIKNVFSTKLGTTFSIEVKIKNWKEAYLQAQRYLCFSDYSYVALPDKYIHNVNFDCFEESGIGILSINNDKVEEVLTAKKSETCELILKYIITSKIIENWNTSEKRHLRKNIFTSYAMKD
jgi:hypothetical protein